ncbi:MAG: pyrroline-5-carboxylate reductase [Nevskia sp.]|nr:pyrroline-5-carboxylate reductase [Nevskia sp.]
MQELIAFVGGGNMAASLIGGLLAAGHRSQQLRVAVKTTASARRVGERFGVACGTDAAAAIAGAGIVVLAVKPQLMAAAVHGLRPAPDATVLSVAAGVRCATLAHWLGTANVVRAMPNTPALFRAGISGLYCDPALPALHRTRAEAVLGSVGGTCWVPAEAQIDAVTALSGCGPAYYFYLTELLREAGAALGLDAATAARLAHDTFIGAAAMARDAGEDEARLREQVTSRGGSTEAALEHLEGAGVRRIFREALAAADARARLRGDELALQAAGSPGPATA